MRLVFLIFQCRAAKIKCPLRDVEIRKQEDSLQRVLKDFKNNRVASASPPSTLDFINFI